MEHKNYLRLFHNKQYMGGRYGANPYLNNLLK